MYLYVNLLIVDYLKPRCMCFAAVLHLDISKKEFSTMFMVGESDLISETFTLYDSTQIRGRPTLNDAERFRSMLQKNAVSNHD